MLRGVSILSATTSLVLCVAACGDDDGGAVESISKLIDDNGGELRLPSGAKVEIPAGALTEPTKIEIIKLDDGAVAPFRSNLAPAGKPYAFKPHGIVFEAMVTITLPFEGDGDMVRPLKLEDEDDTSWQTIVGADKDDDEKTLRMNVAGFSVHRAARPRRESGVVTLPDGAIDDGSSAGTGGMGGDAGQSGMGGGGDAGQAGNAGMDGGVDSGMDAAMADATSNDAAMGDAAVITLNETVEPAYAGQTSWLSYLLNDGVDVWSSSGAPCNVGEIDGYTTCVHAGKHRSVFVQEIDSCGDITISDTLDVFDWRCDEQGNGVLIRSTDLRPHAGLRDLIDFSTPAWRPIGLRIATTTTVYETTPSVWWTDPVVTRDATSPSTIGAQGIHVIASNVTGRAWIDGDRIAVVSAPGVVLTAASTQAGQYAVQSAGDFTWIEVDFAGNNAALVTSNVSVVRHSHSVSHGVVLDDSMHCYLNDVSNGIALVNDSRINLIEGVAGRVNITASSYNTVRDVRALLSSSCMTLTSDTIGNRIERMVCGKVTSGTGILLGGQHNSVSDLVVFADPGNQITINPVELYGARNRLINSMTIGGSYGVRSSVNVGGGASVNEGAHTVQGLRALNAFYSGVRFDAPNMRLINAVIVGSGNVSNSFSSGSNVVINATIALNRGGLNVGAGSTIANIATIANNLGGIGLAGADLTVGSLLATDNRVVGVSAALSASAVMQGEIVVGNSTTPCEVQVGASVGFSATCMSTSPDVSVVSGESALGQLVAETDDTTNMIANMMGRAALSALAIDDWSALDNSMRVWGPAAADGEIFPDPTVYGPCTSNCQIYDLTPRADVPGSLFLDRMATPTANGVITHVWSASSEAECNIVEPNAWNGETCESQLHLLGTETDLVVDDVGDRDGLCEADEPCVRVRNHGAYQGHGALTPATGNFDFGVAGTYRFFDHDSNGR